MKKAELEKKMAELEAENARLRDEKASAENGFLALSKACQQTYDELLHIVSSRSVADPHDTPEIAELKRGSRMLVKAGELIKQTTRLEVEQAQKEVIKAIRQSAADSEECKNWFDDTTKTSDECVAQLKEKLEASQYEIEYLEDKIESLEKTLGRADSQEVELMSNNVNSMCKIDDLHMEILHKDEKIESLQQDFDAAEHQIKRLEDILEEFEITPEMITAREEKWAKIIKNC